MVMTPCCRSSRTTMPVVSIRSVASRVIRLVQKQSIRFITNRLVQIVRHVRKTLTVVVCMRGQIPRSVAMLWLSHHWSWSSRPVRLRDLSSAIRTTAFVDAGTVWSTDFANGAYPCADGFNCNYMSQDYSNPGNIRVSAGISLQWLSPMGPLVFALAQPIKKYEGDCTEFFSFNIGRTF